MVLAEGEERALALWRRERLRSGWNWTIDVALLPLAFGRELFALTRRAFAALDEPEEGFVAAYMPPPHAADEAALQHEAR
jgi:hypothetical protein